MKISSVIPRKLLLGTGLLALAACGPREVVYRCPNGQSFAVTVSEDGRSATLVLAERTLLLPRAAGETVMLFSDQAITLGLMGKRPSSPRERWSSTRIAGLLVERSPEGR